MSNDGFNQNPAWLSVIVVPVSTSESQAKRGPTVVPLARGVSGIVKESVVLCHQVTTLDRRKLTKCIGVLSAEHLRQVEDA